jgi:uncharacterized protein
MTDRFKLRVHDSRPILPIEAEERFARLTIGLLALVHMALATSLVILLLTIGGLFGGKAWAEEPAPAPAAIDCGGTDLVEAMRRDDPDTFAAVEAEAAATPNGEGLLWRIEGQDAEPSWLYGTMHVADARVLALSEAAASAFDGAATVVVESAEIADLERASMAILAKPELTTFTDGTTLRSLLSTEDYALLELRLAEQGVPVVAVNRMKPWMILSLFAMTDCEKQAEAAGELFLDAKLAADALEAGKALEGLETIEEQLSAMASLPMELHVRGLIETLSLGSLLDDLMSTTTELYVAGRIGMIMPMLKAAAPGTDDAEESYAEFEETIVLARNRTMAERALPMLAGGNIFIAVGALHLPGEEGLVELFRDEGYTVTRAD